MNMMSKLLRKKILNVSIFLLIMLIVTISSTFAKTEWIANSCYPQVNPHAESLMRFAEKINERTNGELVIRVEIGAVLGYKGPELLEVVQDGLVQMSDILLNAQSGYEPIFTMNTLPYFSSGWEESAILLEIQKPIFEEIFKEWNQKALYYALWSPTGVWSQKEILTLNDLIGLKIRTYDKVGADFISLFGAIPLAIPFPDLYSSLATGLVNSVYTSTPTAVDAKFWEVLNYYLPTQFSTGHHVVTVNLDAFNALDEKIQQILIDTAKEEEEYMLEDSKKLDNEKLQVCLANGIKVTPVSPDILEALKEKGDMFVKTWVEEQSEDSRCKELLEKYFEKIGRN